MPRTAPARCRFALGRLTTPCGRRTDVRFLGSLTLDYNQTNVTGCTPCRLRRARRQNLVPRFGCFAPYGR